MRPRREQERVRAVPLDDEVHAREVHARRRRVGVACARRRFTRCGDGRRSRLRLRLRRVRGVGFAVRRLHQETRVGAAHVLFA